MNYDDFIKAVELFGIISNMSKKDKIAEQLSECSSDKHLLFHTFVLMNDRGVSLEDIQNNEEMVITIKHIFAGDKGYKDFVENMQEIYLETLKVEFLLI